MKTNLLTIALALLCLPAAGCAEDRAVSATERTLPAEIRQVVAGMEEECRGVDAVPEDSPGLVTTVDLTGDGVDDYVIDQSAFVCVGAAGLFGYGRGGADMQIHAGTPDGRATPAFDHAHFGIDIERAASPAQVVLEVGGELCGQEETESTSLDEFERCRRPLVWDAGQQAFDFAPLSAVRPLDQ